MLDNPVFLRAANLNLLPILRALLRERSVTRAAEILGLSQSATSGALANLRELMGDPLLVQVGRAMQITPRAKQLAVPLEQLCADMESFLQDLPFDPAASDRRFLVAAPDYLGLLMAGGLVDALRATAPRVQVQFIDLTSNFPQMLASGELDIVIMADVVDKWLKLSRGPPLEDRMVVLVRAEHPLASARVVVEADLARYPFVIWSPGLDSDWRAARGGAPAWNEAGATLYLQQFSIMPLIALESDCVVLVPRMLADRIGRIAPVKIFEAPAERQYILPTSVMWSPVNEADAAHRWFRTLAIEVLHRNSKQSFFEKKDQKTFTNQD